MLKESRKFSDPDLNTPNIFCMNFRVSESRILCLNISTTEMVKNIITTTMTQVLPVVSQSAHAPSILLTVYPGRA